MKVSRVRPLRTFLNLYGLKSTKKLQLSLESWYFRSILLAFQTGREHYQTTMRCEDKWVCKYGTGEGAEEWAACTQQNEGGWEMRRDQNSHFHFMDKKYDDTQRTRHGRKYWVATFSETILVRRNNWIRHEAWWWWLIRELFVCIFLYGILFYHAHLTFKDGRCAQKNPRKDYRQSLTLLPLLTLMIKKTKQSSMQSLPSYSRCLLIFSLLPTNEMTATKKTTLSLSSQRGSRMARWDCFCRQAVTL